MNKVLFWDFDGTLVSSPHLWSVSVLQVLRENLPEYPCALEDIRPHLRTGFPWQMIGTPVAALTGEAWWEHMCCHFAAVYRAIGIPSALAERMAPRVREIILNLSGYTLFPDSIPALKKMKGLGWRQYILSNNYPELETTVNALGLMPYFETVITSGKIGFNKPESGIFQYALDAAQRPECCFMIGDNPVADKEGAERAGIPALLVHTERRSSEDRCFQTLTEAADYLCREETHGD